MSTIEPIASEGHSPTASDVKRTVKFTRRLIILAAEIFPKLQNSGPKGHNHISAWVELGSYDLTHLENKYWGENIAKRSSKSAARVARQITKLFQGATESWDEKSDSLDQLMRDISQHNFNKSQNDEKLKFLRRYFGYLASSDNSCKTEITFILSVCQKLIGLTAVTDSLMNSNWSNQSSSRSEEQQKQNWALSWNGLLVGSVVLVIAAVMLLLALFPLGQATIISAAGITAPDKQVVTQIITKSEARYRLDVLWHNGLAFASKGNDEKYFSSMKAAYDLAKETFGTNGIEYAQANNHMVGAYETTGHPDEAIDASRTALKLFTRILGATSPSALSEQSNLGSRLARKTSAAEKQESKDLLVDVVAKYATLDKVTSLRRGYAHALEAYAIYFEEVGDWGSAVLQSGKSVTMAETANMTSEINRGWIIANHAHMLLRSGNCKAALSMYQRAIAAYELAKVPVTQRDYAYALLQISRGCE